MGLLKKLPPRSTRTGDATAVSRASKAVVATPTVKGGKSVYERISTIVAVVNTLMASLGYNNHSKSLPIHGALNAEAQFYKNTNNVSTAHVDIKPSVIHIGEKPWKVHPADITAM